MRMRISRAFANVPHNRTLQFAKRCSLRISVSSSHGVRHQVGSVFSLPQRHADFRPPASSPASNQVLRISKQGLKILSVAMGRLAADGLRDSRLGSPTSWGAVP